MRTKLYYQLSETTTLDNEQLESRIHDKLKEYGYCLMDNKDSNFRFELKGWGLSANQIGKADSGIVKIIPIDGESQIQMTIYINLIFNFIFLVCLLLAVFFFDWIAIIPMLGLILFTWISIMITKTRHKELLSKIIREETK